MKNSLLSFLFPLAMFTIVSVVSFWVSCLIAILLFGASADLAEWHFFPRIMLGFVCLLMGLFVTGKYIEDNE